MAACKRTCSLGVEHAERFALSCQREVSGRRMHKSRSLGDQPRAAAPRNRPARPVLRCHTGAARHQRSSASSASSAIQFHATRGPLLDRNVSNVSLRICQHSAKSCNHPSNQGNRHPRHSSALLHTHGTAPPQVIETYGTSPRSSTPTAPLLHR